jgi:hypothetical protein
MVFFSYDKVTAFGSWLAASQAKDAFLETPL